MSECVCVCVCVCVGGGSGEVSTSILAWGGSGKLPEGVTLEPRCKEAGFIWGRQFACAKQRGHPCQDPEAEPPLVCVAEQGVGRITSSLDWDVLWSSQGCTWKCPQGLFINIALWGARGPTEG